MAENETEKTFAEEEAELICPLTGENSCGSNTGEGCPAC